MGNYFPGVLRKIYEQVEFLGSQVDFPVIHDNFSSCDINVEFTHVNNRPEQCRSFRNSSQIRSHPRQKLFDTERFRYIVVGPASRAFTFVRSSPRTDNTMIGI